MTAADDRTQRWTQRCRAVPDAVAEIRHALVGYAETIGATSRALDAIALAVTEAATNAVLHAFVGAAPGHIAVTAEVAGDGRLLVLVADDGRGMAPRPDSCGLGLGLPLITQLAQRVQIGRSADGGTAVRMEFDLDG